jgi:hypothetical protein
VCIHRASIAELLEHWCGQSVLLLDLASSEAFGLFIEGERNYKNLFYRITSTPFFLSYIIHIPYKEKRIITIITAPAIALLYSSKSHSSCRCKMFRRLNSHSETHVCWDVRFRFWKLGMHQYSRIGYQTNWYPVGTGCEALLVSDILIAGFSAPFG